MNKRLSEEWEPADYLNRSFRLWLRTFREEIRIRLARETDEDWVTSRLPAALGADFLWPQFEKALARDRSRAAEELLDPSHMKQIFTAKVTKDSFLDLFPQEDLMAIRMEFILNARNKAVAHPASEPLSLDELDEFLDPMIRMLRDARFVNEAQRIAELREEAKAQSGTTTSANHDHASPVIQDTTERAKESELHWLACAIEALELLGSTDGGWVRCKRLFLHLQDSCSEAEEQFGGRAAELAVILSTRPDIFELTKTHTPKRQNLPEVRLRSRRTELIATLPSWEEEMAKTLARSRDRRGRSERRYAESSACESLGLTSESTDTRRSQIWRNWKATDSR